MRVTIFHSFPDFQLISYGNGLSYSLVHVMARREVFFQGDDAAQFRDDLDALTDGTPALDYRDALAMLWSDYSEISSPIEREPAE